MNFIYLGIEEVYSIHEALIKAGGGRANVRDFTLLHSSVERPKVTFGGKFLYPTLWLQAGALMQSLVMNHPFTDGNKRTGFYSTKRFLYINGYDLVYTKAEAYDFCLAVDNEDLKVETIAKWLEKHSRKITV